jgi:outer membrane receptor protein involved in Fe transport
MRTAALCGLMSVASWLCGLQAEAQQVAAPQAAAQTAPVAPHTSDSITVTADRGLAGVNDSATSVAVLSEQQMEEQPGLTLDDKLHTVAGFQLFRRTSSWTAHAGGDRPGAA